jgi:integrase
MAKERPKARHKGLYKRGSVWWIRYAGLDGRIRFESSGFTSFKEAQARLIDRKKEVKEGKDPIPVKRIKPHTFKELADHYLIWAERQRSYRRKKGIIGLLKKEWGNLPLRHFITRLLEEYQTKVITEEVETKDGEKRYKAPATANRHLATLKHMFTKAVEWEMVEDEVLKKVRRVKLLPENNRRLRYLSKEDTKALVEACKPHLRPIVETALNTGMRKEEILSLEWERHVDLKHGFILLDTTKNGDRREVPINQTLRETLQGLVRHINSPYVFTDKRGKRFDNVVRSFKSACKTAGIKDFRFHDLRHTFASHLVMAGIDITTVKELLGHKTLTMTLRYAHLAPSHKVKAVEALEDSLGQNPTIQKLYNSGGAK